MCVELSVLSVWYDTTDQPVLPVRIINKCDDEVTVNLQIKSDKGTLHSETVKLRRNEEKVVEIPLPYYGKVAVSGEWYVKEKSIKGSLKTVEVKL